MKLHLECNATWSRWHPNILGGYWVDALAGDGYLGWFALWSQGLHMVELD